MNKKVKNKKFKISNQKPQTVLINKVIVMEHGTYNVIGSGYLITKKNGETRLDIKDLNNNVLGVGWYNVNVYSGYRIGFTTDLIQ